MPEVTRSQSPKPQHAPEESHSQPAAGAAPPKPADVKGAKEAAKTQEIVFAPDRIVASASTAAAAVKAGRMPVEQITAPKTNGPQVRDAGKPASAKTLAEVQAGVKPLADAMKKVAESVLPQAPAQTPPAQTPPAK